MRRTYSSRSNVIVTATQRPKPQSASRKAIASSTEVQASECVQRSWKDERRQLECHLHSFRSLRISNPGTSKREEGVKSRSLRSKMTRCCDQGGERVQGLRGRARFVTILRRRASVWSGGISLFSIGHRNVDSERRESSVPLTLKLAHASLQGLVFAFQFDNKFFFLYLHTIWDRIQGGSRGYRGKRRRLEGRERPSR